MWGALFEMVFVMALFVVLDLSALKNGSRGSRYLYGALLAAAGIGWVLIRVIQRLPQLGNWLEKLTI
ncbi:hypothetical protein DNH61_03070 [Paenibacillus sambharensis]|uniref:Uncharacterized protein n=1 Tax=Paenibacillus sambharensis TaxID=1803190 RepID=A0A2W1LE32_9BACL|nr:hypothetical protein [Paenibacillus sambharensis]PZD97346.1 hypothetical protein DNH61_03070 [Paenibacillus sambharensis]